VGIQLVGQGLLGAMIPFCFHFSVKLLRLTARPAAKGRLYLRARITSFATGKSTATDKNFNAEMSVCDTVVPGPEAQHQHKRRR